MTVFEKSYESKKNLLRVFAKEKSQFCHNGAKVQTEAVAVAVALLLSPVFFRTSQTLKATGGGFEPRTFATLSHARHEFHPKKNRSKFFLGEKSDRPFFSLVRKSYEVRPSGVTNGQRVARLDLGSSHAQA